MHVSHLIALLCCLGACADTGTTASTSAGASDQSTILLRSNPVILQSARIVQSDLLLGVSPNHLGRDLFNLQSLQAEELGGRLNAVFANQYNIGLLRNDLAHIADVLAKDAVVNQAPTANSVPSLQERLTIAMSTTALSGGVEVRLMLDAFEKMAAQYPNPENESYQRDLASSVQAFITAASAMQRERLLSLLGTLEFYSEAQKRVVIEDPAVNGWIFLTDKVEP